MIASMIFMHESGAAKTRPVLWMRRAIVVALQLPHEAALKVALLCHSHNLEGSRHDMAVKYEIKSVRQTIWIAVVEIAGNAAQEATGACLINDWHSHEEAAEGE
jgi:hypothetical protein